MPMNANTDVKVTPKTISSKTEKDVDSKQHSEDGDDSGPLFREFSWYADEASTKSSVLIHSAHDMSEGIAVILEMVEMSGIADDCATRPILSELHRGQLMRMAIASAHLLAGVCNDFIQAANDRHLEWAEQVGAGQ
jgi:hypothetical protein